MEIQLLALHKTPSRIPTVCLQDWEGCGLHPVSILNTSPEHFLAKSVGINQLTTNVLLVSAMLE